MIRASATARLIRTKDGSEAAHVEYGGRVYAVAFSPDGALLATGIRDGTARLIRTKDGSAADRRGASESARVILTCHTATGTRGPGAVAP